jgi:hypothetical protein
LVKRMCHDGVYVEYVYLLVDGLQVVREAVEQTACTIHTTHHNTWGHNLRTSLASEGRGCVDPLNVRTHLPKRRYTPIHPSSSLSLPSSLPIYLPLCAFAYPWVWRRRRRWGRVARHAIAWHVDHERPAETPPPPPLHEGLGPAAPPHTYPRSATATATPKQQHREGGRVRCSVGVACAGATSHAGSGSRHVACMALQDSMGMCFLRSCVCCVCLFCVCLPVRRCVLWGGPVVSPSP